MRSRLLWSLGRIAACLTVVLPAGTAAAAGLGSEDHAFPAPALDATDVQAAFAPNGFAAVAWIDQGSGVEGKVAVALRPPGQDWSAPAVLDAKVNPTDPPTGRTLSNVQLAVNDRGDTAVAWDERKSPSTFAVAFSSRPAGGAFRKPELVNPAITPLVGVDAGGQITFVHGVDTAMTDREFVLTTPAGASLAGAAAVPLSTSCGAFDADLALAPSGDAIVGFHCNTDMVFGVRRNGAWTMSTPFSDHTVTCPTLGTSTTFSGVRVAIDREGHPAGVVQRTNSSSDCQMLPTTSRSDAIMLAVPAGGVMAAGPEVAASGTGTNFSTPPNDAFSPAVGIGAGSVVVEWTGGNANGTAFRPFTRTYTSNGVDAPGTPQPIGDFGGAVAPAEIGVDASGQALVTWAQISSGKFRAFAALRPPGGSFGAPLMVSDAAVEAFATRSGMSAGGDGVIAWLQGPALGPGRVAHARGFDATPPQLHDVSIPATAQVGTPAAFAVQAFDVWGPVSFSWDFGDGLDTGANPSHVFSTAGGRSTTVTATDSAGNSASQTGTVDVTGAGPGGSGGGSGVIASVPGLANVSLTNRTFRVGKQSTATSAAKRRRAPVGTTFRFALDKPASVAIEIGQALPGRRSGRRCVKPTKRLARKKRCTRLVRRGTLTRSAEPGPNSAPFSGRIGRRALKPGQYRASIVATAGGLASKPSVLRFRVVR